MYSWLSRKMLAWISQASEYSEAVTIAKAEKILRKEILDHKSRFDGTFHEGCIKDAIPPTLLQFIGMVEHGTNIKSQLRFGSSKSGYCAAVAVQLQLVCIVMTWLSSDAVDILSQRKQT